MLAVSSNSSLGSLKTHIWHRSCQFYRSSVIQARGIVIKIEILPESVRLIAYFRTVKGVDLKFKSDRLWLKKVWCDNDNCFYLAKTPYYISSAR